MKPTLVAAAVVALAFLSFFYFPGHTWLQQDSQIYTPILEHLRDPSLLRNDVLVQRPHVSFTLYDEVALGLRALTGLGFREVLGALQILTRIFGVWGLYLMATAAGLAPRRALLVAAIVALGAMIVGPQVLTFEYEPTPRAFVVPMLMCAVGLAAHGRYLGAGAAASVGLLMHPPTVYPFCAVYFVLALWPAKPEVMKRRLLGLLCLLGGVLLLWIASRNQSGEAETQVFFSLLTPLQEKLQRLRTSYVWISVWGPGLWLHYALVCAALGAAYWRIRERLPLALRAFMIGLPVTGLLSMPLSWLLLERMGWALMPQFQPMRAVLFIVLVMQFAAAVAAVLAAEKSRYAEAFVWLAIAFWMPLSSRFDQWPGGARVAVLVGLSALGCAALWLAKRGGARDAALAVAGLAGFFAIPHLAGVVNYPNLHNPALLQLSDWARVSTPVDSVFLFADSGRSLDPGVFRSEALRAVYVDWKGGGQVNYLKELGEQWWDRWQQVGAGAYRKMEMAQYRALGVQYVVLQPKNRLPGRTPDFENARYAAYKTP
jgi:hypothetical protein